jgi:hypothetical protein
LDQPISSKSASRRQTFSATVATPAEIDGPVASFPKALASPVSFALPNPLAALRVMPDCRSRFTNVAISGSNYTLHASYDSQTSKGKGRRSAALIGGGGAGGGKSAGIGALVGAGAGTEGAGLTGNREIELPAETRISTKLLQPLELKLSTDGGIDEISVERAEYSTSPARFVF